MNSWFDRKAILDQFEYGHYNYGVIERTVIDIRNHSTTEEILRHIRGELTKGAYWGVPVTIHYVCGFTENEVGIRTYESNEIIFKTLPR